MHTDYPPFFHVLYDQSGPVGSLGHGAHYSVLRSVQWHAPDLKPSSRAAFHDVAVIWDGDHDIRLFQVLLRIHLEGLLPPILFIGERKGVLTVLLDEGAVEMLGPDGLRDLRERLGQLNEVRDDVWSVSLATYGSEPTGIIADQQDSVEAYLEHIDVLWKLGVKPASIAA